MRRRRAHKPRRGSTAATPERTAVVDIERMSDGGRGVGRVDGVVIFVEGGAPGDRAEVRVSAAYPRYMEGTVTEILEPGAVRRTPPCPVFGVCGGCQWQHIQDDAQESARRDLLVDALSRIGKIPDPPVREPLSSDSPWAYRSRALVRGRARQGRLEVGFLARRSEQIVETERCDVLAPPLQKTLEELRSRKWPSGRFELELTADDFSEVFVELLVREGEPGPLQKCLEGIPHRILHRKGRVLAADPEYFKHEYEVPLGDDVMTLRVTPGVFSQIHLSQNRRLVETVAAMAGPSPGRVLDLYCGAGNLTLPLGARASHILGVESDPRGVEDARENAIRLLPEGRAEFRHETAEEAVAALAEGQARFDLIVLDPPRRGAKSLMKVLPDLGSSRAIYVSCQPATLARDARVLIDAGFELTAVQPLDFFPQTFHVESVALFHRAPRVP